MTPTRRLVIAAAGILLLAPLGWIDESGQQLGLGLYAAFIGAPLGIFLVGIALFNYVEPPGFHGPFL